MMQKIPAHLLQKSGLLHPGHPTSSLSDVFDLKQALMHLAFSALFIEVWFFTTHRTLHWPPLFKVVDGVYIISTPIHPFALISIPID
jgi:hypothetical protein